MPRKPRIDTPGALHHVIVRGIERGKIFRSDYDRKNFLHPLLFDNILDILVRIRNKNKVLKYLQP